MVQQRCQTDFLPAFSFSRHHLPHGLDRVMA
jgi:hypothetical protein